MIYSRLASPCSLTSPTPTSILAWSAAYTHPPYRSSLQQRCRQGQAPYPSWTCSSSWSMCVVPGAWRYACTTSARMPSLPAWPLPASHMLPQPISTGCKLNIISSRYLHLSRVITVVDNFQQEMARVLFDFARRGYNMAPLWRKMRHCLRKRLVYRPTHWAGHYRAIQYYYWQALAPPPPPPPRSPRRLAAPAAAHSHPPPLQAHGSDMDISSGQSSDMDISV
jgi:hypothetical protein